MPIEVTTSDRIDIVDVTDEVAAAVPDEAESGVCNVLVSHTTAGVVVNENESRLLSDIEQMLGDVVPRDGGYDHDQIDDNADAHLRALLLGESVSVPVVDGDLALGTWQSILFVECDGPQTRRLQVTTV
jgi:secondary thiamine-phosphate synthase enzyme